MTAKQTAYANGATTLDVLTRREAEVLSLVATGGTNREIALELSVSVATIERHLANVYAKIGARGRADATVFALTRGLFWPSPE